MDTAFKKDTAGCAMGKGFICIKAILKYRHGWLRIGCVKGKLSCGPLQSKLSREIAKQAVTTKCRGEFLCGAKSRDFEKAVDFRA